MKNIIILVALIFIVSCASKQEKQAQMVSDPSYGILLVKADNQKASVAALIEIENIKTEEKVKLHNMINFGNRDKPVIYKLKPGVYRLSEYEIYTNLKPSLDHINYFFEVKAGAVNYVGDWRFIEYWEDNEVDVDFAVKYNPATVHQAKQTFDTILNKWQLSTSN